MVHLIYKVVKIHWINFIVNVVCDVEICNGRLNSRIERFMHVLVNEQKLVNYYQDLYYFFFLIAENALFGVD